MDDFLFELQQLVAKNKIEGVIKILLTTFQKCESQRPESKDEIRGLRNQVVLLSARYNETNDKINSGIIDPVHAGTAKNQLISAFLNIIGKLPEHKELSNYINGLEEEEAWKEAVRKNGIESYRVFFTKYPHGKYKEETQRIISEMETIEKTKEAEIKQKAAEEKERRLTEERKYERENQSQKEKIKDDTEEKVKNAKVELERLRGQKREILNEKQKAKEDLAKIKEKQEELSTREESVKRSNIPLATTGLAAGVSSSKRRNVSVGNQEAPSHSFFQRRNWLWFTLPFITAMATAYWSEINDSLIPLLPVPILYIVAAIKFPLKPKRYALLSTALSGVACVLTIALVEYRFSIVAALYVFLFVFVILSIISMVTLYFRNKNLDKKVN
ncbi:MAG: hypothetical protein ACI8YQ_000601 [Polaribacter sp.]|jgi:hypothetical protein